MAAFAAVFLCGAGGAISSLAASPTDPVLPIYVDPVNGSDATGDGKSWDTAVQSITNAIAKSDTAAYHNERRVCVTLAKGIYELSSTLGLKQRTSLVGDPACDRSEIVLTQPADTTWAGFIVLKQDPDSDFITTVANLTISNVNLKANGGTVLNCGTAEHDRWSKVVSNVVFTLCSQSAGSGDCGIIADGRTLVKDCLFLANKGNGTMVSCKNGGWLSNCRIESCTNASIVASSAYSPSAYNVVEDCTFTNIYANSTSCCIQGVPTVRNCIFADNISGGSGPIGLWLDDK